MSIDAFESTSPEFVPEEFFSGQLEGWGVLESLTGGLLKRSTIKAEGKWDATSQTVSFTEVYSFDDGLVDTLRWTIRRLAPRKYSGAEPRLVGFATGDRAGCAFNWRYVRDTPRADETSTKLTFDDWFYRIDDRVCIVRGSAGKLGLPFVTMHVTYRKIT